MRVRNAARFRLQTNLEGQAGSELLSALQRRLQLMNEITHAALYAPDEQTMLEIAANSLVDYMRADACLILLGDEPGRSLLGTAIRGSHPELLRKFATDPEAFEPLRMVFRTGDCLMLNDLDQPRYERLEFGKYYRSIFATPLLETDHAMGVVLLFFESSRNLNAFEFELCQQTADQIVLAVLKIKALSDARRRLDETETLRKAAGLIAATLEPGEAVSRILDELERMVPYDSASVQLLGDGFLEIVGGRGWADVSAVLGLRFPVPADNPNTVVITQKEPYILEDAPLVYQNFRQSPHNHIRSWLGVPLVVRGELIGMLAIDKKEPGSFHEEQARLVSVFADQVAVLLENARLYESTQRRAQELDALRATVTDITAELDLAALLKAIVERAVTLLDLTGGELGLFDERQNVLNIVVSHNLGQDFSGACIEMGEGLMGLVAETQQATSVESYMSWEGRSPKYTGIKLRAAGAAPLAIGGRLLGVIGVGTIDPEHHFGPTDLTLLHLFAQQAAIAVQNARHFEEIQTQAITDLLTGLFNRRGLFELGEREIEIAKRKERPFSVLLFDIDHFKSVNDRYSHAVGDEVLCKLAEICRASLRKTDILGRYGGEEFVVLFSETDIEEAREIAERFRLIVGESLLATRRGPLQVTISCGLTFAQGRVPELAVLIDQADSALYLAKQAGRNRTCVYNEMPD